MEQEAYRRKGVAALVAITGDIEGRIVFDLDPETAVRVASRFAGAEMPESDELVRETVCELANQVTGNAVTTLNDQGFHFRVHPPVFYTLPNTLPPTPRTPKPWSFAARPPAATYS